MQQKIIAGRKIVRGIEPWLIQGKTIKEILQESLSPLDSFFEWFIHDPDSSKTRKMNEHEEMMELLREIRDKEK